MKLTKQLSSAKCEHGKNFGCYDGILGMWTDDGCRGDFEYDGAKIVCDSNNPPAGEYRFTCQMQMYQGKLIVS